VATRNLGLLICGVVAAIALLAVLGAVFGEEDRPGDPAVYEQIRGERDCDALHEGLDRNVADADRRASSDPLDAVVSSYATAYSERLAELQCPRRTS
jgi:hypothetical protein